MNDLFLQSFKNLKIQDESNDIDPSDLYNLDQSIDLQDLIDPYYIDPNDLYNLDQTIDLSDLFENEMTGGAIDFYTLKSIKTKRNENFKCEETICKLEVNDPRLNNFLEAGDLYHDLFTKIHDEFVTSKDINTKMRFCINHDDFQDPINSAFMDKKDLTVKMMFDTLERVTQSKKKLPSFEITSKKNMSIYIFSADNPVGKGKKKLKIKQICEFQYFYKYFFNRAKTH
jgi:hypothetical protein